MHCLLAFQSCEQDDQIPIENEDLYLRGFDFWTAILLQRRRSSFWDQARRIRPVAQEIRER